METPESIRVQINYETHRKGPPEGFPQFPDLPGKRYTDQRFYDLEKQYLWRKSWLFAGHMDEIPEPGCFKLWEAAGQPVVILHPRSDAVRAYYTFQRTRAKRWSI